MDQKDIDRLFETGSITEDNKKQDEIYKNLEQKHSDAVSTEKQEAKPAADSSTETVENSVSNDQDLSVKKGKVMGQISKVTEESEAGTNLVMNYLEKILNVISKQQEFITDIQKNLHDNPDVSSIDEAFTYLKDSYRYMENTIFDAMDAFQFQDIGRQKLMKVMYTLAKLNDYLNELLGYESEKNQTFGHQIDEKTLEQDKDKNDVDKIVADFRTQPDSDSEEKPEETDNTEDDKELTVDQIIADFQKNK